MIPKTGHMKWYGWGDRDKFFDVKKTPGLLPFIQKKLNIHSLHLSSLPISFDEVKINEATINKSFLEDIHDDIEIDIDNSDEARIYHSYGKSYRDLWRIRQGIITSSPDCVCYPKSEEAVRKIVQMAVKHQVVLIPFGGGTNIVGCIEARDTQHRMIVSLDMQYMNRVLDVDLDSMIVRVQAGILGPELEKQLNSFGVTMGHFPDSFEFSSLGGWVATRSAGMQSDKYGKIEDIVIALRVITPSGTIVSRMVPKASNGIDMNHLCMGSEGILGVISEVTVQVHPKPQQRVFYSYLFPNFGLGVAALQEAQRKACAPSMSRLNDPDKTSLSFACKPDQTYFKKIVSAAMKQYLARIKKLDFDFVCLMLVAFEGTHSEVKRQKKLIDRIYKKYGGVGLGTSPGKSFEKGKYDFPYLRDTVMDYSIVTDVSETAALWKNILPLHDASRIAMKGALSAENIDVWCGCHISHTYQTGASLYFTFAFHALPDNSLQCYDKVKQAAESTFIQFGSTVSHHHAVGYEHMPWLEEDISITGIQAVRGLKRGLDPSGIMNPGKLFPQV